MHLPGKEDFIETQAAFQFGECAAPPRFDLKDLALREAPARFSLAFHDIQDGSFVPEERGAGIIRTRQGWHSDFGNTPVPLGKKLKAGRKADTLSDLYDLGLRAPVLLDMNDAVQNTNAFPTFQYNRQKGAPNSILWPLHRVHGIGSKDFVSRPNPSEPPLDRKEPRLFWRGSLRGFSRVGNGQRSIPGLVKSHVTGRMKREDLLRHLETVPRYVFVSRYFNRANFDIGLTQQKGKHYMAEVPEISRYERPYVPSAMQLVCKYLVSVSGTDVASSFGWQISTNSVVLRESYPWEVFFDCHFRPWEHYVPIAPDFSDIPEKIDWCESHPVECQRMVDERHALIPLLLDETVRREALRRVVQRYNEFWFRWCESSHTAVRSGA
jgi:hypothetical protein